MDELSNPRYANAFGGVVVDQPSGVPLYIDSGDLYRRIVAGDFGVVAPYIESGDTPENRQLAQPVDGARLRAVLRAAGMANEQIDALFAAAASVEIV